MLIKIILRAVGNGLYEARREGTDTVLCKSRKPLVDSARVLARYALADPETEIAAYREGEVFFCMKGNLSKLAQVTIVVRRCAKNIREEKLKLR